MRIVPIETCAECPHGEDVFEDDNCICYRLSQKGKLVTVDPHSPPPEDCPLPNIETAVKEAINSGCPRPELYAEIMRRINTACREA